MGSKDETRRKRLRTFIRERLQNDRGLLIERTGLSKGRVAQLLKDGQPFGERAVASLVEKLNLPADYFDRGEIVIVGEATSATPDAGSANPEQDEQERAQQDELLYLWQPLFEDQRAALLAELRRAHAAALKTIEEMKRRGYDRVVPDREMPAAWTRPAQRDLPIQQSKPVMKRTRK